MASSEDSTLANWKEGNRKQKAEDLDPGLSCFDPLAVSYFFSICSFKCFAQASAVVCWPWRVFFLSTE